VVEGPILWKFARHNARFASIVVEVLAKSDSSQLDLGEGTLVRKVVKNFIDSNGLSHIADKPAKLAQVGAQALAVHLFQQLVNVPDDENERRKLADSYDYGIQLEAMGSGESSSKAMKRLVHNYGLVIANAFDSTLEAAKKKPFMVDDAMQLLAMVLLGVSPNINLLESSSFGYEVLSTHLVKCAIASTLAIEKAKRPTVQVALEKVGFRLNREHAGKPSTSFYDKDLWDELGRKVALPGKYRTAYRDTTQHRQEMTCKEVNENTFPVLLRTQPSDTTRTQPSDTTTAKFELIKPTEGMYLLVDKDFIEAISEMTHDPSPGNDLEFWPPLATVAKGSSPYADGYVNFVAGDENSWLTYTVMVQSKDYFNSSRINTKDLMGNVERCQSQELTNAFGKHRLMCVASRLNKLVVAGECHYFRDYMVYATDESQILSQLMARLDEQRNNGVLRKFTGAVSLKSMSEA